MSQASTSMDGSDMHSMHSMDPHGISFDDTTLDVSLLPEDEQGFEGEPSHGNMILDQERFLPIANVSRVMKKMLPSVGKIAKDAKECVQECVSEFISFITSEASDKCLAEKRKTISAEDLLDAMVATGFDDYVEPMRIFLERYRTAHRLPNRPHNYAPLTKPYIMESPVMEDATCVFESMQPETSHAATISADKYQSFSADTKPTPMAPPMEVKAASTAMPMPTPPSLRKEDMALQQQPMQIYIDPNTKQHYVAIESDEGTMQLYPITIQDGPVSYASIREEGSSFQAESDQPPQLFAMNDAQVEQHSAPKQPAAKKRRTS